MHESEEYERHKVQADVIVEFLEVAFHCILYYRNIYPKAIFCLKRKYHVGVHASRHPVVNEYLTECLKAVKWLFENDGIKGVILVVVDATTDEVIERHHFDFYAENGVDGGETEDCYFVGAEETFREYLLRLSTESRTPETETRKKSFRIDVVTRKQNSIKLNENPDFMHFPWIESAEANGDEQSSFRIHPIKTWDTYGLKVNMFVEKRQ